MPESDSGAEDPARPPRSELLAVVAVAAVLLVVAGAAVAAFGTGLLGGDDAAPAPDGGQPATTTGGSAGGGGGGGGDGDGGGSGGDAGDATTTAGGGSDGPFRFSIGSIEKCGTTCRDVTATLRNEGDAAKENVMVRTELYAGGDRVWKGSQDLGTLGPGESVTRTQRVDVGFVGAGKIKANDGYVTVVTTVRWDGGSVTYRDRRKVA